MTMSWTKDQEKVIQLRGRNILVSAAAGSGKTAVLVERILQRITEGDHPLNVDELLVVTFTRAAAAQMKDRLLSALEQKLSEEPGNEHLQRQTTLIHHAQITTIDGFCSYVVRNYFHEIQVQVGVNEEGQPEYVQLDPGYRIMDEGEARLLRQDVMDGLLEEAYQEGREDFLYYVDCFDDGRSDDRIRELTLKLYDISQSHDWPMDWLEECMAPYELENTADLLRTGWIEAICQQASAYVEEAMSLNARAMEEALAPDGPTPYLDALEADAAFFEKLSGVKDYMLYQSLLREWKPRTLSGKKAGHEVSEERKKRAKTLRDSSKKIITEKVRDRFFTQSPQEILEDLQQSRSLVRAIVDFTKAFALRFAAAKREKNLLDYSDLEHMALSVLVDHVDGRTERKPAARELARRYAEIMIDEYQDSNLVQETLLTAVSRMEEGSNNIFMVGDVKQSIYKFRLARPELFMKKFDTYSLEDSPSQRIDLHQNFRSRPQVLSGVNYIFRQIMAKHLGGIAYDDAAALYPGAGWPKEDPGKYDPELLMLNMEDEDAVSAREMEAHMLSQRILQMVGKEDIWDKKQQCFRKVRFGDIVILLRSTDGWADIFSSVLKGMGIPAHTISKTGYFSAPEVQVVLNYLRLLDNPRQEQPLVSVLTSAMVGLTGEDLARVKNEAKESPFYTCLPLYLEHHPEGELRDKLLNYTLTFAFLRQRVQDHPIHEILQLLFEQTGYLDYVSAMPAGEQREANLRMLLQKSLEYEKTSYSGLFHFIRYINNLRKYDVDFGEAAENAGSADMVQLMTIHGSKGLEFPVVFVAALGKNFNLMDTKKTTPVHADLGPGLLCYDPVKKVQKDMLFRTALQQLMKEESLGEELRVLYVALTRAEQKLILTGILKNPEKTLQKAAGTVNRKQSALGYARLFEDSSYLDWILDALAVHPAMEGIFEEYEIPAGRRQFPELKDESAWHIEVKKAEDIREEEEHLQEEALADRFTISALRDDRVYDEDYRTLLQQRLTFTYPWLSEVDIPVKLSVSELKRRQYEEEQGHELFEEETAAPYIPVFMQAETAEDAVAKDYYVSGGARRGTAMHHFLELLDYEAFTRGIRCRQQIAALKKQGLLAEEEVQLLYAPALEHFAASSLGRRMAEASREHQLHRETQFFLEMPAGVLDAKWQSSSETVLIQGIIDAWFETGNGLVLVDYKTDRTETEDGQDLVEKYKAQLDYYSRALERLTGKKVQEKVIYSFSLAREIFIDN